MENTKTVRLEQEVKRQADSLMPAITNKIYQSGDKERIKRIAKHGLTYSEFIKFLTDNYKEN